MSKDNNKVVASLHKSLCDFLFIITICIIEKVLGLTYFISKFLQTENLDLITAIESIKETTQKLEDIRNDIFTEIYHQVCEISKSVGVIPVIPRVVVFKSTDKIIKYTIMTTLLIIGNQFFMYN